MTLGEKIRTARAEAELTQVGLANAIGASPRAVQLWESGTRQPGFAFLVRIANVTGHSLDWFAERETVA